MCESYVFQSALNLILKQNNAFMCIWRMWDWPCGSLCIGIPSYMWWMWKDQCKFISCQVINPPSKQVGCKHFISCVACRKLHSVEFAEWGEKRERQLRIISFSAGFLSLAFTRFSFFTCLFSTGYPSQPVAEETQGWAEPLCRQNIIYKLLTKKDSPHHLRCKKS